MFIKCYLNINHLTIHFFLFTLVVWGSPTKEPSSLPLHEPCNHFYTSLHFIMTHLFVFLTNRLHGGSIHPVTYWCVISLLFFGLSSTCFFVMTVLTLLWIIIHLLFFCIIHSIITSGSKLCGSCEYTISHILPHLLYWKTVSSTLSPSSFQASL